MIVLNDIVMVISNPNARARVYSRYALVYTHAHAFIVGTLLYTLTCLVGAAYVLLRARCSCAQRVKNYICTAYT